MVVKGAKVIINNQKLYADMLTIRETQNHPIAVIHIFIGFTAEPFYGYLNS
jgi:hypothetical protein